MVTQKVFVVFLRKQLLQQCDHGKESLKGTLKDDAVDRTAAHYVAAHTRAERTLFPLAVARGVPVVAFTSTRWNSLQKVGEIAVLVLAQV